MGDTIKVGPGKPTLLANRIMRRLKRERLIPEEAIKRYPQYENLVIEAMRDEIHQDIIDGTLRMGT